MGKPVLPEAADAQQMVALDPLMSLQSCCPSHVFAGTGWVSPLSSNMIVVNNSEHKPTHGKNFPGGIPGLPEAYQEPQVCPWTASSQPWHQLWTHSISLGIAPSWQPAGPPTAWADPCGCTARVWAAVQAGLGLAPSCCGPGRFWGAMAGGDW